MPTKNGARRSTDDLRPEYDLTQLKRAVRGKYFARASAGTTVVVLEADVAERFPTSKAVNDALRALARVAESHVAVRGKATDRPLRPKNRSRRPGKKTAVSRRG